MGDIEPNKRLRRNIADGLQIMFKNPINIHWGLHRILYKLDTIVRQRECE